MDPPGFGEVKHLGSNAFQARIIRVFIPEEREGDGPVPLLQQLLQQLPSTLVGFTQKS